MTANTDKDHEFKLGLLDDTITVLDVQKLYLSYYSVCLEDNNKLEDSI